VSSRLALDGHGRRIAVVTVPLPEIDVGHVFLVIRWEIRSARPPTAKERREARPPYQSPRTGWNRKPPREVADEELAEEAAIEAARLEQQREPRDLLQAA
jgi:hypothetical protein